MARTQFSAQVYDQKYKGKLLSHMINRLEAIYDAMASDAAKLGKATGFNDPAAMFRFKDYPTASKKMDKLLHEMAASVTSLIHDGQDAGWNLAKDKNAALVDSLAQHFGWSKDRCNEMSRRNLESLKAFQDRRVAGMNLSQRVWNFVKNDKDLFEMSIEMGLAEGESAAELSRDIRGYLKEPNKLFRRVRDKRTGDLRLSKAAKAYHPGPGVYRSSYKNALRMTATETNMAYRTADYDSQNQMPWIIGIEVHTSPNHATRNMSGKKYDKPYRDMCDDLAGVYPKGFKFTGWHPHCRCFTTTKRASDEEIRKWSAMKKSDRDAYQFPGQVKDMPKNYDAWIARNQERIERAHANGTLPYFLRDNYVDGDPSKPLLYTIGQQPAVIPGQVQKSVSVSSMSNDDAIKYADKYFGGMTNEQAQKFGNMTPAEIEKELLSDIDNRAKAVGRYAMKYAAEDKDFNALLDAYKTETDPIKKAGCLRALKQRGGVLADKELQRIGAVDGLTFDGVIENHQVGYDWSGNVNGKTMEIKARFYDVATYKDKNGQIYCYPLGVTEQNVNNTIAAKDAAAAFDELPNVLKQNNKGFFFIDDDHPNDIYYREVYKGFKRGGMYASDVISVHTKWTKEQFKGGISHEIGHHVYNARNYEAAFETARQKDIRRKDALKYPSVYAKNAETEDFAESVKALVMGGPKALDLFPGRKAFFEKEMPELFGRTKSYAMSKARQAARTHEQIDAIQVGWNKRRLRVNDWRMEMSTIELARERAGVNVDKYDEFLRTKQPKDCRLFNKKINGIYSEIMAEYRPAFNEYGRISKLYDELILRSKDFKDITAELQAIKKAINARNDDIKAWIENGGKLEEIEKRIDEAKRLAAEKAKKDAEKAGANKLTDVIEDLKKTNIETLAVGKLKKKLTDTEIIERLGGGDMTRGSCSSLAFAWAGNRAGLDVLDFRDGESRVFFSKNINIRKIIKNVGGVVLMNYSDIAAWKEAVKLMEVGKEYYFATGSHAAILRVLEGGKVQYLELQASGNGDYKNGWHDLDAKKLRWRFGAKQSHSTYGYKFEAGTELCDVELLGKDKGYAKIMEYINTEKEKQRKSAAGSIK